MPDELSSAVEAVRAALLESGLLLKQDRELRNVVTIITGESLRTSWWSHPKARLIFAALQQLADCDDVLFCKLIDGKVTLVQRRVWSALVAVAAARETWQTSKLSRASLALLARVAELGSVRSSGPQAKELELRLLVHSEEVHTSSGEHALQLESWASFARRRRVRPATDPAAARSKLEILATRLGAPLEALPWNGSRRRGSHA